MIESRLLEFVEQTLAPFRSIGREVRVILDAFDLDRIGREVRDLTAFAFGDDDRRTR